MPTTAPYGSWKSPITLDNLVEGAVGLGTSFATADFIYWTELRPAEGGRTVLVRRPTRVAGGDEDVIGADFHVRTLVHEYGGVAYTVHTDDTVYFSNFLDQRIYRVRPGSSDAEAITPEPPHPRSVRYAAPSLTPDGRWLVAVRERHPEPDDPAAVVNDLVLLSTDPEAAGTVRVIAEGHDFYGQPALSPDGRKVAWTSWDHPNMPWDDTELWEADIEPEEAGRPVGEARRVAGGEPGHPVSVVQPKYAPDGTLHYISDRTGWWNLYRADRAGEATQLAPMECDLGEPDWVFGQSSYAFLGDGTIVATWNEAGLQRLGSLRPGQAGFEAVKTELTSFRGLRPSSSEGTFVLANGGAATQPEALVTISPADDADDADGLAIEVVKASREVPVSTAYLSVAEPIEFPTSGGLSAHALYYRPVNPDFQAPDDELPPLIVRSHGGPTGATNSVLNFVIQFWTSRGFAVVDVNYGGSTGYGRDYRERLRGRWGIVDLDDCVNAALFLADTGRADRNRLLIHGGSAGGYTTLCALTFRDVFAAGASYFGVGDLGALARDTHKFESRYMDSMVGRWPEDEAVYEERSPIFHTDQLRTPMILFQGLEDKVVPPAQAEAMAKALDEKGVPFAYVAYEGEQHGFRKAENIRRTSEAELYFYGRVLGFTPADALEPVTIEHEDALSPR